MIIILRILLSIKTRLLNVILILFGIFRIISTGYKSEKFYKNIINDELRKHEKNFNFWTNDEDREKKYFQTKDLLNKIFQTNTNILSDNRLNSFREKGYINFEELNLNIKQISNIEKHFENKKMYLNHIVSFSKFSTKNLQIAKFFSKYASYSIEDILDCKELYELLNNKKLYEFVTSYFGCEATISNANLFWTFPKLEDKVIKTRVARFHRDLDDFKSVTLFINLTDTSKDDGGHGYLEGSHKSNFSHENLNDNELNYKIKNYNLNKKKINGYDIANEILEKKFKERIFYGPKGNALLTDNYGIHRAISPKKPRLVFWLTFSLTQSNGMNNLKISNIMPQERLYFSNLKYEFEDNLVNRNKFKNLINFDI